MAETPVINASPLIYLSKAGLINLLQVLAPQIFILKAVATVGIALEPSASPKLSNVISPVVDLNRLFTGIT